MTDLCVNQSVFIPCLRLVADLGVNQSVCIPCLRLVADLCVVDVQASRKGDLS